MRNEFEAILFLYTAAAFSFLFGLIFIAFMGYWIKYHPRLEKKLSKHFAIFPITLSNHQTIWWQSYYLYQEYEAGMVLGGTIQTERYGKKITWSGSGSFIPSYKTYFIGLSPFGVRTHFKQDGWKGKVRQKREQAQNLANLEKFFGKDLMDKWRSNSL
jgi:hypothetical protein